MIRTLSILGLLIAVALPVVDYLILRPRRATLANGLALRGMQRIIYVAFLIALAGMTLSGIVSLAFGERMHGWMLVLHMTLAPLFSVCIAGLAVLWAEQARLGGGGGFRTGETVAFWLVVASGFVTILSAMLGMMSWFGSEAQDVLLNVHRIGSIILAAAAAYQAGRLLLRSAPRRSG